MSPLTTSSRVTMSAHKIVVSIREGHVYEAGTARGFKSYMLNSDISILLTASQKEKLK